MKDVYLPTINLNKSIYYTQYYAAMSEIINPTSAYTGNRSKKWNNYNIMYRYDNILQVRVLYNIKFSLFLSSAFTKTIFFFNPQDCAIILRLTVIYIIT